MSYDLALNRKSHDMAWHKRSDQKVEIWPIEGADRVAQQVKINLLAFLGEWFLDTTFGVPYLEDILVKNPRISSVETILRSHIASVPNVTRIESMALDWDRGQRYLFVNFSADTDLGLIKDSVKLEMPR